MVRGEGVHRALPFIILRTLRKDEQPPMGQGSGPKFSVENYSHGFTRKSPIPVAWEVLLEWAWHCRC